MSHNSSSRIMSMDQFELQHAKLLFAIHDLSNKKQITSSERSKLKRKSYPELVISTDPVLFNIISVYEASKDADTLYTALVKLVRPKPCINIPPKAASADETTSPLDTFLQSRKKVREHYHVLSMEQPTLVIAEAGEEGTEEEKPLPS